MHVLRRTLTGTDDKFFIPFFNLAVHRNSTTPRNYKVTYVSHIKGDDVNRDEDGKITNSFYFRRHV